MGGLNHGRAAVALAAALALALAACSDGSSSSDTTRPEDRSPGATITLSGSAGLAGRATEPSVRCNWPSLDGLGIAVLAQPPDAGSLVRIQLRTGAVAVYIGSGEGPEYHEREFRGAGVTSFDAARGARIDSTLTETSPGPGSTAGDADAVTAISGSVDCGDQTPGRSTVTITGETAHGPVAGAVLDPVRVECADTPGGNEVTASGLMDVGSTEVHVSLGLASDRTVSVDKTSASGARQYRADRLWTSSANGGYVEADVVEQETASPRTLHVEGDLSCGRNASG